MSRQTADTRFSTPTKFPFRPDSHLKTFLPGTQSSDISNCSSSESEVSFSGEVSLLTPNISIDDYIAETRESLSLDFKCLECNKTIYYGAFSKCKACLGYLHPSCTNEIDRVESSTFTICTGCKLVNPPETPLPEISERNVWKNLNGQELIKKFDEISRTTSKWTPNLFLVPFGKEGQSFVDELTRLTKLFVSDPDAECYALSATILAPTLILQKPSKKSKAVDHKIHLKRRLELWLNGKFDDLVKEGQAIQKPLLARISTQSKSACDDRFINLMRRGQSSEATGWLESERHSLGPKKCTPKVLEDLEEKHPPSCPMSSQSMLHGPPNMHSPVTFEKITGESIYKCARNLRGNSGPSGLDAVGIQRILCSRKFKRSTTELRDSLSMVARKLATSPIHPRFLDIFCASKLVPLAKSNGGTRPIGIGETWRRVLAKTVVRSQKQEIQVMAGKFQLAAGTNGGCEAAIHALNDKFSSPECHGVLLLDARNAFNSLNRKLALYHSGVFCPIMNTFFTNLYGSPRDLYVDGNILRSEEGATQGCPSSMGLYCLGIGPLIDLVENQDIFQVWFADDGNAAGTISNLLDWYEDVYINGVSFGYHVNPEKSILIVKPEYYDEAIKLFKDTGVTVTKRGARHLGAVIGSEDFKNEYISNQVAGWEDSLRNLVRIGKTHPHLAYSNFTRNLKFKWNYVQRTVPDIGKLFEPLEEIIRHELIPVLLGTSVSDKERCLLALPVRMGGLGLDNPVETANHAYSNSRYCTEPLVNHLMSDETHDYAVVARLDKAVSEKISECELATKNRQLADFKIIHTMLNSYGQRLLTLNTEPGASSWLTARPIESLGYELTKQEFQDAMRLRFGLHFPDLNLRCACGKDNDVDHALSCAKGGYAIMRHDKIRDSMAEILSYAGVKGVETERLLQPCEDFADRLPHWTNQDRDARMDIVGSGLWQDEQLNFFDVRVVHANSASYLSTSPAALYKDHENRKKRCYMRRVHLVEGGSFTPLIMSTTGGLGEEFLKVIKKAASRIEDKHQERYPEIMATIKQKLRFSMLRSTLRSLRGCRVPLKTPTLDTFDFNL